jgi:general secretion pathway protein E
MSAMPDATLEDIQDEPIDELLARLLADSAIGEQALERARRAAVASGERIDQVLLKLGLIDEAILSRAWAVVLHIPFIEPVEFPTEAILQELLPGRFLRASRAMPIAMDDRGIRLAVSDPLDQYVVSAVASRAAMPVSLALAAPSVVEKALDRLYPDATKTNADAPSGPRSEVVDNDIARLQDLATDAPAIRAVEAIIERAVEKKASDIHLTTGRNGPRLRFRVDGVLRDGVAPPTGLYGAIISRLKILADLDIAERRLPQDGRIRLGVCGREIDLRLATMPHLDGEGAVLRILDRSSVRLEFRSLGFTADVARSLVQILGEPHGILLVTGPTGSGKTTTLYAALSHLVQPERNVVSVEDPVEYHVDGVAQIQVQRKVGLDFPTVLRAVLRQDPDVIMVGEIRDSETATIANQAALTGHFVLATLHTNSAAASIPRLIDMGVEPFLLSTTLRGILAQRLVRTLCRHCSRPARNIDASGRLVRWLMSASDASKAECNFRDAVGCGRCNGTGYLGRMAIAELLVVNDGIRDAIHGRADEMKIAQLARTSGLLPMDEAGAQRVLAGETTVAEFLRVVGERTG